MKNLYNFGFITLLLVVLGCNCQRFQDLSGQGRTPTTTSSPSSTSSPAVIDTKGALTLEKFNRLKNGMSYKEVVEIVGSEGAQVASSGEGKYKVESYKWDGENFQYLIITFMGEKLYSKNQNGLK